MVITNSNDGKLLNHSLEIVIGELFAIQTKSKPLYSLSLYASVIYFVFICNYRIAYYISALI